MTPARDPRPGAVVLAAGCAWAAGCAAVIGLAVLAAWALAAVAGWPS